MHVQGDRSWRHRAGFVGALVLVLLGSAAASASAASFPHNARDSFRADLQLLAHIPDGVRQTCLLGSNVFNTAPGNHWVATLECHPDADTTITYRQHRSRSDMANWFDAVSARNADQLELDDEQANCEAISQYKVDGRTRGSSMCQFDDSTGAVSITWTYAPLAVSAILEREDGDATAARATWSDDAGPAAVAQSVPRVLSRRAARTAGDALLATIPDADTSGCVTTDLSDERTLVGGPFPDRMVGSPELWLDAEVVCEGDYPNRAVYRRYRDDAAYAAAYDATHFLEFSEPDDPACPDGYEDSWSVDDADVGRVACYYLGVAPGGEAHMRWTYDPDRIVAEAYALRQASAQRLYDWWLDDAGPQV